MKFRDDNGVGATQGKGEGGGVAYLLKIKLKPFTPVLPPNPQNEAK